MGSRLRAADAAGGVVLAMAHSCAVVVRDGSAAAAFVETTGQRGGRGAPTTAIALGDDTARHRRRDPSLPLALSRGRCAAGRNALSAAANGRSQWRLPTSHVPWGTSLVEDMLAAGADELVSVVIPLFNQGHFLLGAIESVHAAGDIRDVEIVVVDDGSTDQQTIEIFDKLTGVTKVRQANAGLSAARNAGIAAAAGRYIVPLDSDDLLSEGFLAPAVDALRRNPDLGYVAGYLRYFGLLDYTHVPAGYVPHLSLVVNTHVRATACSSAMR